MTQVTVGPPWSANGPVPQTPPHTLLSLPGVLVPEQDEHWGVGIEVWPYPRDLPETFDPCSTGTFREKSAGDEWNLPIFGPFTAYMGITCSSITAAAPGFADRVRLAFQARESYAVSHELAWGTAQPLNPFLTDGNTFLPAGSTVLSAAIGLAYLENAIGATAGTGIIHATPAVATAWTNGYQVQDEGGVLRTNANNTPVAVSYAYYGAVPRYAAPLDLVSHPTYQWVFASSPVQARRNDDITLLPDNLKQAMAGQTQENLVTFRAERNYAVTYDAPDSVGARPVQAAVLIDWST